MGSGWGGRQSYMTLHPIPSEIHHILGKFDFLFYQCDSERKFLFIFLSSSRKYIRIITIRQYSVFFFWRATVRCLMTPILLFLEMSEFEPRELLNQAAALPTQPPISQQLSHPSLYDSMQTYLEQHGWVVNYGDAVMVRYVSTPWEEAQSVASIRFVALVQCAADVICNEDGGKMAECIVNKEIYKCKPT